MKYNTIYEHLTTWANRKSEIEEEKKISEIKVIWIEITKSEHGEKYLVKMNKTTENSEAILKNLKYVQMWSHRQRERERDRRIIWGKKDQTLNLLKKTINLEI